MKAILIVIVGAVLVFIMEACRPFKQKTEKGNTYLTGGDSNIKADRMKVKKSILNESDQEKAWDMLIDNHMPKYDETNHDQLDEVSFTFSLLVSMHYQIANGGFMAFVDNGSGDYFHETIEAAKRIKYDQLVDILSKMTDAFPMQQVPKNMDKRRAAIDKINDKGLSDSWDSLDKLYYANEQTLYRLTVEYLKVNAVLIDQQFDSQEGRKAAANKSYKTYAVLQVLKVCAIKFRQQGGTEMQVFTRIRLIAKRWLQLLRDK